MPVLLWQSARWHLNWELVVRKKQPCMVIEEEHSEQKKHNPCTEYTECTQYTEKEMSLVCLVCPSHSGIKPQWLGIGNLSRNGRREDQRGSVAEISIDSLKPRVFLFQGTLLDQFPSPPGKWVWPWSSSLCNVKRYLILPHKNHLCTPPCSFSPSS